MLIFEVVTFVTYTRDNKIKGGVCMKVRETLKKVERFFILIALIISVVKAVENEYPKETIAICCVALIFYIVKIIFVEKEENQLQTTKIFELVEIYCGLGSILAIFVIVIFAGLAIEFQWDIILKGCYITACISCIPMIVRGILRLLYYL